MRECENVFDIQRANQIAARLLQISTNPEISDDDIQSFGEFMGVEMPATFINRAMMMRTAIERVRGSVAATTSTPLRPKNPFMERVFQDLVDQDCLHSWVPTGGHSRVDYSLYTQGEGSLPGAMINVEAKGGLDGNSTKITDWNPSATEMWKWHMMDGSMANSPPTQVTSNRYVSDLVKRWTAGTLPSQLMNGFFVLDYICGSDIRPCPKSDNTIDILSRIESSHRGWTTPFPDFILLPRTPFIPSSEENDVWNSVMPSEQLVTIFSDLWNIDEPNINLHIHEVHIQIRDNRFRYRLIRRGNEEDPWFTSAWRATTR